MQTLFQLKLYTTSACHLCMQANELLLKLQLTNVTLIEIADDDDLITLYGERIPVLQRSDNAAELNWPFTQEQIIQFIQA